MSNTKPSAPSPVPSTTSAFPALPSSASVSKKAVRGEQAAVPVQPKQQSQSKSVAVPYWKRPPPKTKTGIDVDLGAFLQAALRSTSRKKNKSNKTVLKIGMIALPKPRKARRVVARGVNPLDSTAPKVKRGVQRRVAQKKRPTRIRKALLKTRQRKQAVQQAGKNEGADGKQLKETEHVPSLDVKSLDKLEAENGIVAQPGNDVDELAKTFAAAATLQSLDSGSCTQNEDNHQATRERFWPVVSGVHSNKFREYCTNSIEKPLDTAVSKLLKKLLKLQKKKGAQGASQRRRLVIGLREVHNKLKSKAVKLIIIAPDIQRHDEEGGLDEVIHSILVEAAEQGIPVVNALSKRHLGYAMSRTGTVSIAGVTFYDAARDEFNGVVDALQVAQQTLSTRLTADTSHQEGAALSLREETSQARDKAP
eukprot:m.156699 g.156699  ORF g.156699 m.156699 type:complete len:422 (-) comp16299_c1_seq14:231-1496(-)